jgi:hypothetical protein
MQKPVKDNKRETSYTVEDQVSINAPSSTSETQTPNSNVGGRPFFGTLPRELRDAIYDYTFEHMVTHQSETDDNVTFHFHAPISVLRLVSRQFTVEYDERYRSSWPDGSVLSIDNNSQNSRQSWKGAYPRLATRCRATKTSRTLFDGYDKHNFETLYSLYKKVSSHCKDLSALVTDMPHLRRVDVSFNCESLRHSHIIEHLLRYLQERGVFETLRTEGTYELRYQGLTYPLPRNLRDLDVSNIHILRAPVTLVAWTQASRREHLGYRV